MTNKFTLDAEEKWFLIPKHQREILLNNVWCSNCGKSSKIIDYSGRTENDTVILEGKCQKCQEQVVRVID